MLKFYFNTMTKTHFTLKYSRIHIAQACSSKAEWQKEKQNFYTKGWLFPSPPSHPPWSSCIFPQLGFWSRKVVLWLQTAGRCFLLFLQMLPKGTEGRCYISSTDFQKKTLIPWSTHALPLKSRFWAQKEIGWHVFYLAFYKKGMFGVKCVFTKTSPNYTISLLHSARPKESFRRTRTPGEQIPSSQIEAGGGWSESGLTPKRQKKELRIKKRNLSKTRWVSTWAVHRQTFPIRRGASNCKQAHSVTSSWAKGQDSASRLRAVSVT